MSCSCSGNAAIRQDLAEATTSYIWPAQTFEGVFPPTRTLGVRILAPDGFYRLQCYVDMHKALSKCQLQAIFIFWRSLEVAVEKAGSQVFNMCYLNSSPFKNYAVFWFRKSQRRETRSPSVALPAPSSPCSQAALASQRRSGLYVAQAVAQLLSKLDDHRSAGSLPTKGIFVWKRQLLLVPFAACLFPFPSCKYNFDKAK